MTGKAKWYEFHQNNSGGSFDVDEEAGVGVLVFIEANSCAEANLKAEDVGIYFDGVRNGMDCPCCGERWYEADECDQVLPNELVDRASSQIGWGKSFAHPIAGKHYEVKAL